MCVTLQRRTLAPGRRTRTAASRCCRRTTSRSCGISLLRGAMSPEMGRAEDVAKKIRIELEKRGLHKEPLGVDIIEPPILFALQREGISVVDGQRLMSDA